MPKSTSPIAVEESLRDFERTYCPFAHQIDGWSVWPVLRTTVAVRLQQLALVRKGCALSRPQRIGFLLSDLWNFLRLRPSSCVAITATSYLTDRQEDVFRDIRFDDALERIPSAMKVEVINNAGFLPRRRMAARPSTMTTTALDVATSLCARLRRPRCVKAVAALLTRDLQAAFGPECCTGDGVEYQLTYFYWQKRWAKILLRRAKPALLIVADPGEIAYVAAAKELGVSVIELQHGFLDGITHPGYAWSAAVVPYQTTMAIPDQILLFGDVWKEGLDVNGFWGPRLKVVGNPRIDRFRARRAQVRGLQGGREDRPTVMLVTTQGVDTPNVIKYIQAVLRDVTKKNLCVVVKLHPVYESSKDEYLTALGNDRRVQIISGQEDPPTFELLCVADVHVSISSTCHYEAIALGVPTVILPLSGYEAMHYLYEQGHAILAGDEEDFVAAVARCGELGVSPAISERFFRPRALDHLYAEISQAIAESRVANISVVVDTN